MMDFLAQIIAWINVPVNALARFLLAPIAILPGWLSNTFISAIAGILLLTIFKYTSKQHAIGRVRDNIKANLLALKLFKDSLLVTLQAQGRIFKGAFLLLLYAVVPMMVMVVPVSLLLGQMGLWYQSRPLQPGEEAVVTMKLNNRVESPWPEVKVKPIPAIKVAIGPVRVFSKHEICWSIKALESGYYGIAFQVDDQNIEKELAIGYNFMRVSAKRPGRYWSDILKHPWEKPFGTDSIVQSISVAYPDRLSWTSGTRWWLVYFFAASMIFALIFKPLLKVRL